MSYGSEEHNDWVIMPGYLLVQKSSLSPPLPPGQGVQANKRRIGLLDFLRELAQEDFPFDENSSLLVEGTEDVLLAARTSRETEQQELAEAALMIRAKLQKSANAFFACACPDVQVVFRQPLQRGDTLIVNHVTAPLPIHIIFGSPPAEEINGQRVYRNSFNLSTP